MKSLSILPMAFVVTGLGQALAEDAEFAPKVYATRADGSAAWELATLKDYPHAYSPELSPDGTRVALDGWKEGQNGNDAHILVVNLNDGAVEDLGRGAMPSWSADGTWIACSSYAPHGVCIRQVQGGMEELIEAGGWGIQWSPDGKRLAYARGGNLIIYDLATKTKHAVFPEDQPLPYQQIYHNCGWSPDSKQVCFKGLRQVVRIRQSRKLPVQKPGDEIVIVSVDGDPKLRVCCDAADVAEDVAWHPDGTRVVIPKAGQLYEFNPSTSDPPQLVPGLPADRTNAGMCWSRDGEVLIFMSYRLRPQAQRLILDVF